MTLLAELQDVVARRGLTIAFQPAVDVRSGAPLAFEALARWHHPRRGEIPPSTFVPLAEYSGLITHVTRQMLAAAVAACRTWHESGERLRVARAAIELAHALGLEAVAEGVEDGATLDLLRQLSCDQAQGFHIAAPMGTDEILEWVRARRRHQVRALPA